jgi:chorismate dehydratase
VRELDDRAVLLSASSRTSVLLLQLLCRHRWEVAPRFATVRAEAPDLAALGGFPHEAVLVIGDAALLLASRREYPIRVDLGAAWKEWTGLPFVFAVWAARRSAARAGVHRVHERLLESRAWGLAHLDELSAEAARTTGVSDEVARAYIGGLDYALSYRHLAGLTDFFRRLAQDGLVPDGSLSFISAA